MYVEKVKLKLTKQQYYQLNKTFFIAYKIYVICTKYAQKQLRLLYKNKRYKYLIYLYGKYKQINEVYPYTNELKEMINLYDLNKTKLEKYLKVQSKKYKHILTSTQVQCIADTVAKAVDKCLYGNGKNIHIKKFNDFNVINQKAFNGFKYNGYDLYFLKDKYRLKGNRKLNVKDVSTLVLKNINNF